MTAHHHPHYDVAIIGAGLGGLLCGVILAKHGFRVVIVEKNKQIGGALQTFAFHKKVFDSCVHYIGGLGKGHTLHRIFQYAGIMDDLSIKPLDKNAFDKIYFGQNPTGYPLASGTENFKRQLLPFFPKEEKALENYLNKIENTISKFPLFHLRNGSAEEKNEVLHYELQQVLTDITSNPQLRAVLSGNALLYAGQARKTPFYLHALVESSYVHSSHKIVPGSSAISKLLHRQLRNHGGTIIKDTTVEKIVSASKAEYLITQKGQKIYAHHFISNLHPLHLQNLVGDSIITPAFYKRMQQVVQTPSCFILNAVVAEKQLPHKNFNLYWHADENSVLSPPPQSNGFERSFAIFSTESGKHPGYSSSLAIMFYGHVQELAEWQHSYRTTSNPTSRGQGYEHKKNILIQKVLAHVQRHFPEYSSVITATDLATPLTFRDYLNTPDGSLYGIAKDVHHSLSTTISVRTKISNLYLTGQNINLHGVLGVAVTALATCGEILGMEKMLDSINQE